MYMYVCVCMYTYIYIYMCVYVYIYIYIYIHTFGKCVSVYTILIVNQTKGIYQIHSHISSSHLSLSMNNFEHSEEHHQVPSPSCAKRIMPSLNMFTGCR